MQQRLAATFSMSGGLLAGHVDRTDIVRLEKSFGNHRRRAKNFMVVEAIGNIAIVGGGKSLFIKSIANLTDLLFEPMDVLHHGSFRAGINGRFLIFSRCLVCRSFICLTAIFNRGQVDRVSPRCRHRSA